MKKIRYILFLFFMMVFFPFSVMAGEKDVYWNIESGRTLHYSLQRMGIYNDKIEKIIFNDISSSDLEITDGDKVSSGGATFIVQDTILYIQYDGTLYLNENSSELFSGLSRIKEIKGLEYVNTSKVKNMSRMFANLSQLSELDLSSFDTSNVTDMRSMFSGLCYGVQTCKLNLSGWDTSNVTNMSGMFYYSASYLLNMKIIGLDKFNTSKVTNMSDMFRGTDFENLDLSNFDTSNVTDMSGMFYDAKLNNLNLGNVDTSRVVNMSYMFSGVEADNLDLSMFDTSNVTDMSGMFSYSKINNINIDNWDTSNVIDMRAMFRGTYVDTNIDFSKLNTSNVTDMRDMFYESEISMLDLSTWNTLHVTNMSYMFYDSSVSDLNVNGWDTSNVTDMRNMFDLSKLSILDLSSFDTSNVLDMRNMFRYCWWLKTIYVSDKWSTENVLNSDYMFTESTLLKGSNGTVYNSSNVGKEMATIDSVGQSGYLSVHIGLTSDEYIIGDDYVYTALKQYSYLNVHLENKELELVHNSANNSLSLYYNSKVVKEYDIVTISSSYYDWGSDYIYLGTDNIDINKINITNGSLEIDNNRLLIKYDDKIIDNYDLVFISSDAYNLKINGNKYIYLGTNDFNIKNVSITKGDLIVEDNKLLVKYKDKILDQYDLIKVSSDKYDLSKKYILSTNELFDIDKVNVINGYLELDDSVLKVYYDDVINGITYKMLIGEYDIVNITSEMQDVTKPYLYFNRNYGSEQSVLKITNAKQYVNGDKLNIFYENELLFSYDIVSLSSNKYNIGRDYIYTKNNELDLNDISIRGVNVKLEKKDNKLNIYYGEELIKIFDLITLSSDLYNVYFDDNISGYMYIGNKELDLSKINAISGKLKEQDNILYICYGDEYIDSLKIVSVSSDKYTIINEEIDYIYVGEDYIDKDKVISGIKVINGTAKFDRNSNGLIYIIPDGFNSLSLGSFNIITAITDITLNVSDIPLGKGDSVQILATINPFNTLDDKTLIWKSENESIAKVYESSSDNSIVYISAVGPGETKITVTTMNGKSATVRVVVSGFDIDVESNNISFNYDGGEHQIIPTIKTLGSKILYSLDGVNYNLDESPKFINPGKYKVYYKVTAPYYEDYYGYNDLDIIGIVDFEENLSIKDRYLIVNNYDNSLYNLIHGINLYIASHFYEYRYVDLDGGVCFGGYDGDFDGAMEMSIMTGYKLELYIDSVVEPPKYIYNIVLRGDLSGDGEIDSLDLATMLNHISGKKELMGAHLEAAYLNNDEDIDSLDLAYLMNHIAGKEGY